MNMLKEMAEEVVVREVIYTLCELEPARKRAGFFIGKIAAKTYNRVLLKK